MNIIFMGTPDFAVPCLERLVSDGHIIAGVFTKVDKPKGRGNIVTPSPVKVKALENNFDVYQPVSLKDEETISVITQLKPDLIVVTAYGKILNKEILNIPVHGCINIHASVLPKYRGAAPIQWAIINGESETGITSMQMDEGLDTGDMLLSAKTAIGINETAGELFDRLSKMGAEVLSNTIDAIVNKTIVPVKQDDALSSYAPMIKKTLCRIDWQQPSFKIHNLIRGLSPFLSATTTMNGKTIKIISSSLGNAEEGVPGEVVDNKNRLLVACGNDTTIELNVLQLEGKKALPVRAFLLGNKIEIGQMFI